MKRFVSRAHAYDLDAPAHVFYPRGSIKYINRDRAAGRGALIVIDFLMHHANQVRARRILHVEAEPALSVGPGARLFLHAIQQSQQDDFVSGNSFAGAVVTDGACDSIARSSKASPKRRNHHPEKKQGSLLTENNFQHSVHGLLHTSAAQDSA